MNIDPKAAERAEQSTLWPKGTYDAFILESIERESKNGNEMIRLNVEVYWDDKSQKVFDYLTDSDFGQLKLKRLCEATGVPYAPGYIDAKVFNNKPISVSLKIDKDKSGTYADKNAIVAYKPRSQGDGSAPVEGSVAMDDTIPF